MFEKDGRWMPVGPISMQERAGSYKDTPRGPTLKVEIGRRGLESLFESSGMVATRRHWVHLQILEEKKRRGRRKMRDWIGGEGVRVERPELKLTSADRMWSE